MICIEARDEIGVLGVLRQPHGNLLQKRVAG